MEQSKEYLHDRNRIIVEHSGDVFGREFVRGVTDKEACFPDGTITDHHAPMKSMILVSLPSTSPSPSLLPPPSSYLEFSTVPGSGVPIATASSMCGRTLSDFVDRCGLRRLEVMKEGKTDFIVATTMMT